MKKIILITDVMDKGGVDTYIINLVEMALQKGCEIEIILESMTKSLIPTVLSTKCKIHHGPLYHRIYSEESIAHFIKESLERLKPTLVHVVCGIPWACLKVREEISKAGIPLIFTEQYVTEEILFSEEQKERIKNIYKNSHGIIFVSYINKHLMMKKLNLLSLPSSCVIFNGINYKSIKESCPSFRERYHIIKNKALKNEKLKILFMGRLTKQKGADILINSLNYLSKNERERIQLDMYGEGPECLYLKKIAINSNLGNLVNFYPWVNNPLENLSNYDLFVLPSRGEGLSFVLLEALASHITVIASDINSNREATKNGQYAQLFKSEDVVHLSQLISKWINLAYSKKSVEREENNSKWLERFFDKDTNLNNTFKLWRQILDK